MPHMADSYSFALAINDQLTNGGQSPMYSEKKLQQILDYQHGKSTQYMWATDAGRWNAFDDPNRQDVMPTANTDWLHELFGDSFTQEHSISVNGGTDVMQYYMSANYLDEGGLLKYGDDGRQRYSFTGKINADLAKWLKVGYSVRFNRIDYSSPSFASAGENKENVFYFDVCRYWPVIPVVDPNGFYTAESKIYQLTEGGRYNTQNDVVAQQLQFLIEPIKNWKTTIELNYRSNYNFSHTDYQTVYAYDVNKNPYAIANTTSGVTEYAYKSNFFNPNIFTEYSLELENGHNMKAMVGFQSELFKQRDITAKQNNIMSGIPTLNTTTDNARASGGYQEWATAGFFGRINYDYKGRYLVEANLRYDGSSRFLADKRWAWFPSVSLGWNIAREEFFEKLSETVNTLKLRGSWGQLGNTSSNYNSFWDWYPFYQQQAISSASSNWLINGEKQNTSSLPSIVNATMTWETVETWDFGFDFGAFNNRLTGTFDWYSRTTKDMIGPAPILGSVLGTNAPKTNNCDMRTSGWELEIGWRDQINDFKYGVRFNLSDNRSKILTYPYDGEFSNQSIGGYYNGKYLNEIWGYESVGLASSKVEMDNWLTTNKPNWGSNWGAGDVMYKDLNGDGIVSSGANTLDDHGDLKRIGNATPRYRIGLNLDAAYKGFDFSIFFQGVLKRDWFFGAGDAYFWGAQGNMWQSACFEDHLDYWTENNTGAYYPKPYFGGIQKNQQTQTRYLQSAAYLRCKNIQLGYTLPKSLLSPAGISNCRIYLSCDNLFTITSLSDIFDPEAFGGYGDEGWGSGKTYPLQRTVSVGVNLSF